MFKIDGCPAPALCKDLAFSFQTQGNVQDKGFGLFSLLHTREKEKNIKKCELLANCHITPSLLIVFFYSYNSMPHHILFPTY